MSSGQPHNLPTLLQSLIRALAPKTQHFVDTEASSTLRCMTQRCLSPVLALFQALAKSSAGPKSHRF